MKFVYSICVSFLFSFLATRCDAQSIIPSDTIVLQNLEIFSSVYRQVIKQYPGNINPANLMHSGMNPMLQTIDPFTRFFPENEVQQFKTMLSGKFGGIGVFIGSSSEGIFIKEVFGGFPAAKAGIQTADLLVEINGIPSKNKTIDEIVGLLKGAPGSNINLRVRHPGENQNTTYTFPRELININPVSYFGMLNENIAYLHLERESEHCSIEVTYALKELKNKFHFKGLILDLRNNEGGYMKEALKIANLFLQKGNTLLSIGRKESDTIYTATEIPVFPDIPIVIIINNSTISSGEILSGALQDNDRAVFVGQKTFGKGLIQEIFEMPYGTELVLTTGQYFTPSGRCIQSFEYENGDKIELEDSLKIMFKSKTGRSIYSGGGISPDILTPYEQATEITKKLVDDLFVFDFATQYVTTHQSINTPDKFHLTDEEYNQFISFVKNKNFTFSSNTELKLKEIRESAEKEENWQDFQKQYAKLSKILTKNKEKDLAKNKSQIKLALEEEIISRYYFQKGRWEFRLRHDKEVKKAMEIVLDKTTYNKLLNIKDN